MKRIWFKQQKPFDYMPLRAGLSLASIEELAAYNTERARVTPIGVQPPTFTRLCEKIYTTRTRGMSGEYYVVEGSRFKANAVEPEIKFEAAPIYILHLRTLSLRDLNGFFVCSTITKVPLLGHCTFPELDLGYRGATFEELREELLKLNPKATIDTPFYVNKLTPIEVTA